MLILWVRLDYTCTPRGGTSSLRMTDFNNSTEVAPRGPLTPSHKRKHLLSFHSQATETSSRAKHFRVFSMTTTACKHAGTDNFSSKDHSSFYSARDKKQADTGPSFMSFTFSAILQFRCTMYCARLIKLPHTATGGGSAGSRLCSNKYLFVNSKIAA